MDVLVVEGAVTLAVVPDAKFAALADSVGLPAEPAAAKTGVRSPTLQAIISKLCPKYLRTIRSPSVRVKGTYILDTTWPIIYASPVRLLVISTDMPNLSVS
ncbi:MAG: hypothetical protein JST44_10160 [Cyanobacteria bacterium SZAS LIN-5]|nr:hypothetical protein [Cyanobacteria bacterium SZAS LIN-5]